MPDPDQDAPISPFGWKIVQYFYDGERAPSIWGRGKSLSWCRRLRDAFYGSAFDDGGSEMVTLPEQGWESLQGDPVAALVNAVASGDLPRHVAVAEIKRMMKDAATVTARKL